MVSSRQRKEAEDTHKKTKTKKKKKKKKTITDADYANDIALLANTPAQAESQLLSLEQASACIGLHINAHKTEYMHFNQRGEISTLNVSSLKLVDKFTYLGSSVSSTKTNIKTWLAKTSTAVHRL